MSLRARMGVAAGVAVALAVLAVSISAYAGTRSTLLGQVDNSLRGITGQGLHNPNGSSGAGGCYGGGAPPPGGRGNGFFSHGGAGQDCDRVLGINGPSAPAFGGAAGFV